MNLIWAICRANNKRWWMCSSEIQAGLVTKRSSAREQRALQLFLEFLGEFRMNPSTSVLTNFIESKTRLNSKGTLIHRVSWLSPVRPPRLPAKLAKPTLTSALANFWIATSLPTNRCWVITVTAEKHENTKKMIESIAMIKFVRYHRSIAKQPGRQRASHGDPVIEPYQPAF